MHARVAAADALTAQALLAEAEQALTRLGAMLDRTPPGEANVAWLPYPALADPALNQASVEILAALQRVDVALAENRSTTSAMSVDTLTGLPSSAQFHDEAAHIAQAAAPAAGETFWVLVADIDRFAAVNDRHGHRAGDERLAALAQTMRQSLSPQHQLARVGGDDFAAILRGDLSMEKARAVAETLRAAAEEIEHPVRITISVGLAGWLPASERFEDAFRRADNALYSAKNAGGNRVYVSGIDDDWDTGLAVIGV